MIHPHDVYTHPWMIRPLKIAELLIHRGHSVTLCYFPDQERRADVGIIHEKIPENLALIPLELKRRAIFKNTRIIYRLAKNADVIHFQKCNSYVVLPALLAAIKLNKPLHYDWDDYETAIAKEMNAPILMLLDIAWYEKFLPKVVDTISASSHALKEKARQLGMPKDRIFLAPVGADLSLFHPSKSGEKIKKLHNINGYVIIYSGQLEGASYAELLLKAVPLVQKVFPETKFIIVGGGQQLPSLKNLVKKLGLSSVIFTGYVPHNLVTEYIAAADIAVACFEENHVTQCKSPLKIVEYLASGKPIVASSVGEVVQMINGCGILVEPGNYKELADQIIRLLSDENLRKELSKKARQRAEQQYNWSNTVEKIERAYNLAVFNPRTSKLTKIMYFSILFLVSFFVYSMNFFKRRLGF